MRQTKTPRQRAQEQLGVAERVAQRLGVKAQKLRDEFAAAERDYHLASDRAEFLRGHPDLAPPTSTKETPK